MMAMDLAAADPTNADVQRGLAIAHTEVGRVLVQQKQLTDARPHFEASLAILRTLAENSPESTQSRQDLSIIYNAIGDLSRQEGRLAEARQYYELDLAVTTRLADQHPESAGQQHDLMLSHYKLALVAEAEKDYPAAMDEGHQGTHFLLEP